MFLMFDIGRGGVESKLSPIQSTHLYNIICMYMPVGDVFLIRQLLKIALQVICGILLERFLLSFD